MAYPLDSVTTWRNLLSTGINTTADTQGKQEFIPAEEYDASVVDDAEAETELQLVEWDETMARIAAQETQTLRVPRNTQVSRKQVISAFVNAFELIGGVPRLALWAHGNPGDFYKLYARLLPSQASAALGESTDIVIKHVLPRTSLDG